MAPLPDAKHLLELLQRAAEELKTSQRDAAQAQAEVKSLHEKLAASEAALAEERLRREALEVSGNLTLPPMRADFVNRTVSMPRSEAVLDAVEPRARDDKTNVGVDEGGLLAARLGGLQDELQELEVEKRALKERVAALEAELATPRESLDAQRRSGELEHELSGTRQQLIVEQARGADLLTRLQAWEARSQELDQALTDSRGAADEEHAQLDQLAGQLSQVETELTTERARSQAQDEQLRSLEQGSSDEQKRLFEATARVAQLEMEVSGLKGRRDELNLEIGKVEKDRNAARARAAELEQAAEQVRAQLTAEHQQTLQVEHQKRNELDQQLSREKDKHQITAQKLLEARGKGRDAEEQLQAGAARIAELTNGLESATLAHREELAAEWRVAQEASADLTQRVADLTQQLETATVEWRHTDKQYEQLHKEMLILLDQRDEARRELEAIKQRFGIR